MNKHCALAQRKFLSMQLRCFSVIGFLVLLSSCGIYKFNDASLKPHWKTVKINYIDNRASYVNPQLAQKFNDKLQQKITTGNKLTRVNDDNANLVINGTIVNYDATQTVGVGTQQATVNRLTVSMRMTVRFNTDPPEETKEFTVSRSFDYSANLSLQQAEGRLLDEVVRTMTDEIFNQIFSEW
jgi:hypothetical protein